MSEARSNFDGLLAGPPRAVIPDSPAREGACASGQRIRIADTGEGAHSSFSALVCEHCGNVSQNVAAARYHTAKLCGVLYPLAAPIISESVDSSAADDFESNPEWEHFGFRGKVAEVLMAGARDSNGRGEESGEMKMKRKALRLKRKAIRFANCGRLGRSAVCSLYPFEHKFYAPHDCGTDFCMKCAQGQRRALFEKYLPVILNAVAGGVPKDWTLARVTFTLRSDGTEITPERVREFNSGVRFTIRKSVGSRDGYGFLFSDEVGFETRGHLPDAQRVAHGLNLHCHGLYFGPYVDWERTRDLWATETKKRFGVPSTGFFITEEKEVKGFRRDPERAVRWALNHLLKYLSKPPAVTAERLASLILSFDGAKRVHALGKFYGKCPKKEKANCPCPTCKRMGLEKPGSLSFEGKFLPNGGSIPRLSLVGDLVAQGYLPLHGDGRTTDFGDFLVRDAAAP
ncbi:MAG TPA: hypothetical protein VNE63_02080 [Candidatus Acidoferrales bacterium]|nr:hypothetical protein [Candidatus Acidoferrales bacterium]